MINTNIIHWRLNSIIIAVLLTAVLPGISAQESTVPPAPEGGVYDSTGCRNNISLYKAFLSDKNYYSALEIWRAVIIGCPAASEELYIDGESIYKELFEGTGDMAYIDSLLVILTQRTYYFDGKVSNDLHKSELLFDLAGDDPLYLGLCYNILAETADLSPDQMDCTHYVRMATVAASLYAMGIIDSDEMAHAFVRAISTVETRMEYNRGSCRSEEDLANMEMFFRTCGAMTCESVEALYARKVDRNFRDTALVNRVFAMLTEAGCTGTDFYYNVAVKLFANDRSAVNAVRLAELNVARNNIERATSYFTEAYNRDTSRLARSEVITRVAVMELERGRRQDARDRAEHAWQLNNRNGRALLILAECYAGAEIGSAYDNHSAYWVAVDYLQAAAQVDPSLKEEADEKIRSYSQLFPTREECFYRKILDEGIVVNVGSWINEVTRVRFRKE